MSVPGEWIDFTRWDIQRLHAEWRQAEPFPHIVIDDFVTVAALDRLRAAIAAEPHWPVVTEIYEVMASRTDPENPVIQSLAATLGGSNALAWVTALSGCRPVRVDICSYVYLAGSFLLPHSDRDRALQRLVAYSFYLSPKGAFQGGELELIGCDFEAGEIVRTRPMVKIDPIPGRIVLLEVSERSLHQVREVVHGARMSLSGWFYA